MKYKSIAEFLQSVKAGNFTGEVIVDNDCVYAYVGDDRVFDFEDHGPEGALVEVLLALGIFAVRP